MFGLLIKQRLYRSSGITYPQAVHNLSTDSAHPNLVLLHSQQSGGSIMHENPFQVGVGFRCGLCHLTVTLHHNI